MFHSCVLHIHSCIRHRASADVFFFSHVLFVSVAMRYVLLATFFSGHYLVRGEI